MIRPGPLLSVIVLSLVAVGSGCNDSVVGETYADDPPAAADDAGDPECPGEVTVRRTIPDTSIYIGQNLVLPIDGSSWTEPFFTQTAGRPLYFDHELTSGDTTLASVSTTGERRTRLHIEGRREGAIGVTISVTDGCSPEVSEGFSITIIQPAFPVGDVFELKNIRPVSLSAAANFPDSLRSGTLPHIIDGGYGHTGVGQPARSFWVLLESAELDLSLTREFQLLLRYAVFTDGQPYDNAVLGERCSWAVTGTYAEDDSHLTLVLYSEPYSGTSDGQVGIVAFDELLVQGCRQWAYEGQAWEWVMRDARFTLAD